MNTFFMLCLAGIILNCLGITLNFFILNVIGSIILTFGIIKLPLSSSVYKKARLFAAISVPFSVLAFYFVAVQPEGAETLNFALMLSLGINIFFLIYITYYFTEMLIDFAKSENKLACTKSFRSTWTLCGIVTFLYYMLCTSISMNNTISLIARAVLMLVLLYYNFTIYGCQKILFKNFSKK